MIAVKKSTRNVPNSLHSKECSDSLIQVIDITNDKHKDKIDSKFYRADDVLLRLINLYHSKCAYCETRVSEPEIEHYRPKKQINGIKKEEHKGYYWLAYEWTNLLPACHDCNKNGVKGNHFPIEGTRKSTFKDNNGTIDLDANQLMSAYLQDEKPLLLNPETPNFDPFVYFEFNNVGQLLPKSGKKTFKFRQADETIKIIQLNRDKLFGFRKNAIQKIFRGWLKEYYKDFLTEKILKEYFEQQVLKIIQGIFENANPKEEYSFFWSYLYRNFLFYIRRYFKKRNQREVFVKIYEKHIFNKSYEK